MFSASMVLPIRIRVMALVLRYLTNAFYIQILTREKSTVMIANRYVDMRAYLTNAMYWPWVSMRTCPP